MAIAPASSGSLQIALQYLIAAAEQVLARNVRCVRACGRVSEAGGSRRRAVVVELPADCGTAHTGRRQGEKPHVANN